MYRKIETIVLIEQAKINLIKVLRDITIALESLMSRQNSGSGMLLQATPKHASKVYVTSFLRKETKLDSFFKSIGIYQKYLELKESRNNSEENDDVKL